MSKKLAACTIAAVLLSAGTVLAHEPTNPDGNPKPEKAERYTHDQPCPKMAEHCAQAQPCPEMADCQAAMAERQAFREHRQEMEARLDALVATMQKAGAADKVDAIAAVVTELLAQRKEMQEAMAEFRPMMEHRMRHMHKACGMARGHLAVAR